MENNNGRKLENRLTTLEVNVKSILTNHLPTLQKGIDKLSNRFWAIIVLLIANLVGLVFTLFK